MRFIARAVILGGTFLFCYHLDYFVGRLLDHVLLANPAPYDYSQNWWDLALQFGVRHLRQGLNEFLRLLAVLASRIFWPFLFAAIAVPLSLPRRFGLRNTWSIGLSAVFLLAAAVLLRLIQSDMAQLWAAASSLEIPQLERAGAAVAKIKWVMLVTALGLTFLYTLLYRVLRRYGVEQVLVLLMLAANIVYIFLLDPIPGEVDDVLGLLVTFFLSIAVFIDGLLMQHSGTDGSA